MALAFKDTVEGCSIPLALQAESNTAREKGGGRKNKKTVTALQRLL